MASGSGLNGGPPARWQVVPLALAAPLLILLALLALLQRSGQDRVQALPALAIGLALLLTSGQRRRRRRADLLQALREERRGPSMDG